MKIAVLGDMHFAIKSSSETLCGIYMDNMNLFLDKVFFPYIDKHNIKRIFQTGDFYDNRLNNANKALANAEEKFVDEVAKRDITMDVIVGNHDMPHIQTLRDNMVSYHLSAYSNIIVHTKPYTSTLLGTNVDFIPWICDENKDEILKFISNSKSAVCVCHPEINGFEMTVGQKCETGLDRNIFKNYKLVIAGHFHNKSKQDNIQYVGTPTQHNYGDINDTKGFWVLDTETLDMEFIPNPYNLFQEIVYSDDLIMMKTPDVKDKYVSIKLPETYDSIRYKAFIDELLTYEPHDITATQDRVIQYDGDSVSLSQIENKSIKLVPFLTKYTHTIAPDLDENILSNMYTDLYSRAMQEQA